MKANSKIITQAVRCKHPSQTNIAILVHAHRFPVQREIITDMLCELLSLLQSVPSHHLQTVRLSDNVSMSVYYDRYNLRPQKKSRNWKYNRKKEGLTWSLLLLNLQSPTCVIYMHS